MAGILFLCLAGPAAAGEAAHAPEKTESPAPKPPPVLKPPPAVLTSIERLFQLQDGAAAGEARAAQDQKPLLFSIGENLAGGVSPEDAPLLAPAVAAYVLSGGDPAAAERLQTLETVPPRFRHLLEFSALFMRGEREKAEKLAEKIDPRQLPASLAGRIALAMALLGKDEGERQAHLALAMAAMPGTLVEESALRRSALAYAEAHKEDRFWQRLARYHRRFPESLYARSFWEEALGALVTWAAKEPGPDVTRLDPLLSAMPLAQRMALYLFLARQSAAAEVPALAEFAARRVGRLASEGSAEAQVAALYTSLYAITSPDGDAALARLATINRQLLSSQDAALLDAALAMGRAIERPPSQETSADDAPPEKDPLTTRAEQLLGDSEKLLADRGT